MTVTTITADPVLPRLKQAIEHVFGDQGIGTLLLQQCDDYRIERERIGAARGGEVPVIAVVGATGQGKTWLTRALIREETVQAALPSGDRSSDRTRQITWIGPTAPAGFDPLRERYLPCANDQMHPIGTAYCLVDTPGMTDVDAGVAEAARTAVTQAAAHLLVVRRDQLRAGEIDVLAIAGEGALVLPLINVVRQKDDALQRDVELLIDRIRSLAPTSQILDPILIEDGDKANVSMQQVAEQAAVEVGQRLAPHLRDLAGSQRLHARLNAAKKRFHRELAEQLTRQLPDLAAAESRLSAATAELPTQVAETLIGSDAALQAAVRTRLRLALLNDSAAIWFPYRTLLSLLNLTHGAWDRLMLAMAGSLPSLVTAAWASANNLRQMADQSADKSSAVHARARSIVQDRLRPLIGSFRRELQRLRQEKGRIENLRQEDSAGQLARLVGLDALQSASQQIFDEQIAKHAPSPWLARLLGLIGTAIFWLLFSGPIVSLYRDYTGTSLSELTGNHQDWRTFPEPSFGMVFTSALLSVLPTAIYAMFVLAWVQSRRRVLRCTTAVQNSHEDAIERLKREGILQLEFDDPLLDDARLILNMGQLEVAS